MKHDTCLIVPIVTVKGNIVTMTIWSPALPDERPLYRAIVAALASDIDAGRLRPGDRLPPHRELAWRLKVTTGTVSRAYKEAEIRGLLVGEVGRGSFVRQRARPVADFASAADAESFDLLQAIPPRIHTTSDLDAAMQRVMRESSRLDLLDYTPADGHPLHREMGARWLARSGIEVDERDVIVTAGAHAGLISCLAALAGSGTLLAESLNYASLRPTAQALGTSIAPVDLDKDGMVPDSLERAAAAGNARAIYLVPSCQNPTTAMMPRERREAIVGIARRYSLDIIEDDIFRLLAGPHQPPTVYSLAPERTWHITSLSKTLAPGLRVGFVLPPDGRAGSFRRQQTVASGRAVGLTAEIARHWIETDIADSILARNIAENATRRRAALEILGRKGLRCEQGSIFGWLPLPPRWTAEGFAAACRMHRVNLIAGNAFAVGGNAGADGVRLCFGAPRSEEQLRRAFRIVSELIDRPEKAEIPPVA